MELPRVQPASRARDAMGLGTEMPDYDLEIRNTGRALVVRGHVVDPRLRALCGISSAFPADFETTIVLDRPVRGFRARYRDKVLEIVAPRKVD
jgi:HSP20 family molecular chaperone IbpA